MFNELTLYILTPLFSLITMAGVSLFLFFRLLKNNLLKRRTSFAHWSAGFALLSLVYVPAIFVNAFGLVAPRSLITIYVVVFFTTLIGYLLIYRGTALLLTQKGFWLNTFPILIFFLVATLVLSLFFFLGFHARDITAIFFFVFLFPANLYLTMVFFWFYVRGCSHSERRHVSSLIISFAWLSIVILEIVLLYTLLKTPAHAWLSELANFRGWYLAKAGSHLVLLLGFILFNRCVRDQVEYKENQILAQPTPPISTSVPRTL